jgi:ATP-dependent Clp protease ATP-binding subunit ClpA
MFERYTESARRVLFFARYEVSQRGGLTIEPEHILLGVLREAPTAITRFSRVGFDVETWRHSLAGAPTERVSTSVEIPFSSGAKAVLERACVEADDLKNRPIAPEHLVLGTLLATSDAAARALGDAGVEADAMREFMRNATLDTFEQPGASSHPARAFFMARGVPGGALSGVVLRQWRGVVAPGLADQYIQHLHRETLPSLSRLTGFIDATILRREVEDGTEFQVTTVWRSLDAIKVFAGDDVTTAVVPPAAATLMVRYDDRAVHYDIVP